MSFFEEYSRAWICRGARPLLLAIQQIGPEALASSIKVLLSVSHQSWQTFGISMVLGNIASIFAITTITTIITTHTILRTTQADTCVLLAVDSAILALF